MASSSKNFGLYKSKNPALSAACKTHKLLQDAKRKREFAHSLYRNIQESPEVEEPKVVTKEADDRRLWLLKWKEDKKMRLQQEKMKKKPVFKTGVVQHSVGSPYFQVFNDKNKNMKGISEHKFKFQHPNIKVVRKLTVPIPPKFSQRKTLCKMVKPEIENRRILRSNVIKENVPLKKAENRILRNKIVDVAKVKTLKAATEKVLSTKVKTPSPKTILTDISNTSTETPAKNMIFSPFSPNVCLTRGKRRPFVRSADDLSEEDKKEKKEKKVRSQIASTHFAKLEEETKRLHSCADSWNSLVKTVDLPVEIINEVDALTGKTRLLTSDKFMQFRRLVEQFDGGVANPPITPDDLIGFWEMVYLQVEELDKSFRKLDDLKSNGWKEEAKQSVASCHKKVVSKPMKSKKPAATSSLKNFIAAARQNKKLPTQPNQELKTFDAGSFQIISPAVQSPASCRKSSVRNNLLRQAVSSESKPKSPSRSAINAVRKSILGRSITSSPMIITNQNEETPRSILRKPLAIAPSPLASNIRKKSLRFGHLEYQDIVTSDCDSSCDREIPQKKSRKIKGTPYKRVSLNETFSADEDESPGPKPENNSEMTSLLPKLTVEAGVTPHRRSRRLHKDDKSQVEVSTFVTPVRRSARLSSKSDIWQTPVAVSFL